LQEAAIASDDLGEVVAAEPLKGRIDIHQRVVGQGGVGDRHAYRTGVERLAEQLKIEGRGQGGGNGELLDDPFSFADRSCSAQAPGLCMGFIFVSELYLRLPFWASLSA